MILSHFTPKLFKFNPYKKFVSDNSLFFKPKGLWLSDETDYGWKKWCLDQEFLVKNLRHERKFKVNLEGILHLHTEEQILNFTEKYSVRPLLGTFSNEYMVSTVFIDWERVQKDYSGIIVTPYRWKLRFDRRCIWYYTWDCASACIWDMSKLEKLNRLRHCGALSIEFKLEK